MPNTQEYTDWLTMESLDLLTNSMEISDAFNTDYNKEFTKEFAVGDTVRIPFPWRPQIRNGLGYAAQNIDRIHTTVTVNQIFGVDFEWDSAEEALKLTRGREKIQKEILGPAMSQMKQEIESRCALWAYQNTNNIVGVLGTNPTTLTPSAQARQRMVELAGTKGKKRLIIPPAVNTGLVPAFATYFQPADAIAKQYKEGIIGRAQNFDWSESMSLYSHTAGTWAGAVTVNGANQSGSSLILTCTTGDTFLQGDVISIAGRFAVNPATRRITTRATTKQFVVQATVTGVANAATISILPAIVGPGSAYQNIDSLPTTGDVLTLFPGTVNPNGLTGTQGLALGPDAFALVGVKLANPEKAEIASQTRDPNSGISIAFVRMFDPIQRKMVNRFDCMIGFGNLYNDSYAVRYLSA